MSKTLGSCAALLAAAILALMQLPAQAQDFRKITIVNGTRTAMVALQARPSQTDQWQSDSLNRRTLGIRKQMVILLPANATCHFDLMAQFEDGHRIVKRHLDLCRSPVYVLTDF